MKTKLVLAIIIAVFAIAIGTLTAGQHNGWPNHGIVAPGQPNHYASPRPQQHP